MTTGRACHVRTKLKRAISRRAHRQSIERRQTAGLLRRRLADGFAHALAGST
jgi:hypothetical protein